MVTAAPPKPPPPLPPAPNGSQPSKAIGSASLPTVESGLPDVPIKAVIYGTGGIGKTELCANIQQLDIKPLFVDLDNETSHVSVFRVRPVSWEQLRATIQSRELLAPYNAIVLESLTKAESLAVEWVLANVKNDKGNYVKNIESFGFGKGFTHVYETFLGLLGDLDACHRRGMHVICTAHEFVANVPNPSGEDWIRYEPRLQVSKNASIRHRVKEWCQDLFFIGYDARVDEAGKAIGGGTCTIYPKERPTHLAKSRNISEPMVYPQGSAELWKVLLSKGE
jgi:hypothetical protein